MVVEQTHQTKHRKWSHTMKSEEKHNVTDKEICSPCEGHTVTFRHGQIRRWHVQALLFTNKESRLLLWGCFILLQSCVVKWITNPVVIKNLHQATMPTSKSELRRFGLNVMQDVIPIHVTLLLRKPFFFFWWCTQKCTICRAYLQVRWCLSYSTPGDTDRKEWHWIKLFMKEWKERNTQRQLKWLEIAEFEEFRDCHVYCRETAVCKKTASSHVPIFRTTPDHKWILSFFVSVLHGTWLSASHLLYSNCSSMLNIDL